MKISQLSSDALLIIKQITAIAVQNTAKFQVEEFINNYDEKATPVIKLSYRPEELSKIESKKFIFELGYNINQGRGDRITGRAITVLAADGTGQQPGKYSVLTVTFSDNTIISDTSQVVEIEDLL